jgi:hypothetical protein
MASLDLYIKYTVSSPETYLHTGSGTLFTYDVYMPIDQTQRFYLSDDEAIELVLSGVLLVSTDGITALSGPDGVAELTFSKKDNFSYKIIGQDRSIKIPGEQQMIVFEELEMISNGELTISGELVLI